MAKATHTGTMILDCGILGELEVDWEARYYPGTPDRWYMPNGDPGYPGDPAELEVLSAKNGVIDLLPALDGNGVFMDMLADEINKGGQHE